MVVLESLVALKRKNIGIKFFFNFGILDALKMTESTCFPCCCWKMKCLSVLRSTLLKKHKDKPYHCIKENLMISLVKIWQTCSFKCTRELKMLNVKCLVRESKTLWSLSSIFKVCEEGGLILSLVAFGLDANNYFLLKLESEIKCLLLSHREPVCT